MSPIFRLKAKLDHLAIVSWRVRADRLARLLPSPLIPQTVDAAGDWGLVSMAMMLDTTTGNQYRQLNERAYVTKRDGTGAGAYFWRSHASSAEAVFYRYLLGIPEYHADLQLDTDDGDTYYKFDREGRNVADLVLRSPQPQNPSKFPKIDLGRAKIVSENPLIGYTMNWGQLCETIVEHDVIDANPVTFVSGDPTFMIPSSLIERDAAGRPEDAVIAVYQRDTPFIIALPPRPVGGGSFLRLWSRTFCPWMPL
jgi:hypothetical protein